MTKINIKSNAADSFDLPIQVKTNNGYNYNMKQREKFILYCIRHNISYEDIGNILGITRQRVYEIYRYGHTKLGKSAKEQAKERDYNTCRICGKKSRNLHVHHIKNPKDHSQKNLISLCAKCHKLLEMSIMAVHK